MRDIGKNIKLIRQAKEMTQEALAEALYVTRQTVSNYENGRSNPDLDMLLKIADVLDADINTIIYGPPIPQSKKRAYQWAVICLVLFALTWIAYFTVAATVSDQDYYGAYMFSIRIINKETLIPLGMFLLGWGLLHTLSLFCGLRQIHGKYGKIGRIILLTLGIIVVLIPLPYSIWHCVAAVRSYTYGSISMTFPYIPVYQELYFGLTYVIYNAPFFYSLLGGLFWLFGLPAVTQNPGNGQDKFAPFFTIL